MPAKLNPTHFLIALVKPYAGKLFAGALVTLLSTLAMLSLPQFLKRIFDDALGKGDTAMLATLSMLMMVAVAVMVIGVYLRVWLVTLVVNRMFLDLRNRLTAQILRMDVGFFETRASGELLSRMVADGTVIREFVLSATPVLVRGIFLTVGALVALGATSSSLTLILLGAAVPLVLSLRAIGVRLREIGRQQQDNIASYSGLIEEGIDNIRTVQSHGQQGTMQRKLERKIYDIMLVSNRYAMLKGLNFSVTMLVGFVALVGVVWVGGNQVIGGTLTLGEMMAFLFYLAILADGTSNLSEFWPAFQTTRGAAERLMDLLEERPAIKEPSKPKALPVLKGRGKARGVRFEGVSFAYPSRAEVVVADGISLAVKAGQKVALVGPSGAGKTTLFSLLLRFYDVQAGRVAIDGVDVRDMKFADLRGALAVVSQEASIFSATVRENVAFGRPGADDADVWQALRVAHADSFVKDLPQGLDTPVGEKGVQLSGGQRQRLAIARAVLVDAPILLLDEATSHLDAESERAVQAALEEAGQGRTVITIAHRLSTVRAADVIYVFDKGRIVAHGDHAGLMKSSPLYRALASLQMA